MLEVYKFLGIHSHVRNLLKTRKPRTVLNGKSKSLIYKNSCKVKLVKLNRCQNKMAGVIEGGVADNKPFGIRIMMDQDIVFFCTVSSLSLIVPLTTEFEVIYYTRRKIESFFFCGIKLRGRSSCRMFLATLIHCVKSFA
jgi:hypothetical protein